MSCEHVKVGNTVAIVCSRGQRRHKCQWCALAATLQCDWKVAAGKTCDKHLCAAHGSQVAPDKHLCPEHQVAYRNWMARKTDAA